MDNAFPINKKLYPNIKIAVKCEEGFIPTDRRPEMSVLCEFVEESENFEWNTTDYSTCIEINCMQHKDFKPFAKNITKTSFAIGEQVTYTCPGGYRLRTICEVDLITGFGEWDFIGSCSGIYLNSQ